MLSLEMSKRPFPSLATLWQVIAGANTPPHSNMVCFPFVQEAGEKDQLADVALRLMKSASPSAKTAVRCSALVGYVAGLSYLMIAVNLTIGSSHC
eukprot:m.241107 g.241107  ORF g.241107 m.241107 type:complete len:95 (-) comp17445_c0_seq45:1184-1468(-)